MALLQEEFLVVIAAIKMPNGVNNWVSLGIQAVPPIRFQRPTCFLVARVTMNQLGIGVTGQMGFGVTVVWIIQDPVIVLQVLPAMNSADKFVYVH